MGKFINEFKEFAVKGNAVDMCKYFSTLWKLFYGKNYLRAKL